MKVYFDRYAIKWRSDRFASDWEQRVPWVIRAPKGLIGFMLLCEEADHYYVSTIQIDIRYRGRGLGTALMQYAELWTYQAGRRKIALSVYEDNPALHWYQELGYQRQGEPYFQMRFEKELVEEPQAIGSKDDAPPLILAK